MVGEKADDVTFAFYGALVINHAHSIYAQTPVWRQSTFQLLAIALASREFLDAAP